MTGVLLGLLLVAAFVWRRKIKVWGARLARWAAWDPRRALAVTAVVALAGSMAVAYSLPSIGGGQPATTPSASPAATSKAPSDSVDSPLVPSAAAATPPGDGNEQLGPAALAQIDTVSRLFVSAFTTGTELVPSTAAWRANVKRLAVPGLALAIDITPRETVPTSPVADARIVSSSPHDARATVTLLDSTRLSVRLEYDGTDWLVADYGLSR